MEEIYEKLKNNRISSLRLDSTHYTHYIDKINKYLYFNTSLNKLCINNVSKIGSLDKIGDCLKYNSSITHLELLGNYIINIDGLAEGLKYNSSLTVLKLWNNHIENIDKLSESLKINSTLQILDLSRNKIKNIDNLGISLKYNSSLEELDLSFNKIENIDIFGKSLFNNKSLKKLNLECNEIEDIYELTYSLYMGELNLINLDLCNNEIKVLGELIKYIQYTNCSLEFLDLRWNNIIHRNKIYLKIRGIAYKKNIKFYMYKNK